MVQDKSSLNNYFQTFFEEVRKTFIDRIKNDDFGQLTGGNQLKKVENGKQNVANKNTKLNENATSQIVDPIRTDLKIKIVRRINLLVSKIKEFVNTSLDSFSTNFVKMELITQNVFKSEYELINSLVGYASNAIEKETKLEYLLHMQKFKLLIDKDCLNFVVSKPKPLFDLDKIEWVKFDEQSRLNN